MKNRAGAGGRAARLGGACRRACGQPPEGGPDAVLSEGGPDAVLSEGGPDAVLSEGGPDAVRERVRTSISTSQIHLL